MGYRNAGGQHAAPYAKRDASGSGASSGRPPSDAQMPETKAAKSISVLANSLDFNPALFTYRLFSLVRGPGMEARVLEIAISIIRNLAESYDAGMVNDTTANAKRLLDTVETYRMPY